MDRENTSEPRHRPTGCAVNLALAVVSLVVSAAAGEVFLRLIGFEYTPLKIEVRNQQDARPFHMFEDRHFIRDPELIWRPKKAFGVFNGQGFRGPEIGEQKPAGEFRVLALGDSNTLGWAGDEGPNWPGYLQELMQETSDRFVVANAGVWGYSSHQGLARLREMLRFQADVTLISFGANDAHLVLQSDREYATSAPSQIRLGRWLSRSRLGHLVLAVGERRQTPDEGELRHRVGLDEYQANLAEMVRLARAHGAQAVLLTRPFTGPVLEKRWKQFGSAYNEATARVAERQDVPLIDVYSLFKGQERYFADESHFTEDGHRLAARIVFERLEPLMPGSS